MERRTNDTPLRNGKLDEGLVVFRTEPINEQSGLAIFQFETGGFSMSFKRGMTMTEFADKFSEAAERVRRYQANGWPMIQFPNH